MALKQALTLSAKRSIATDAGNNYLRQRVKMNQLRKPVDLQAATIHSDPLRDGSASGFTKAVSQSSAARSCRAPFGRPAQTPHEPSRNLPRRSGSVCGCADYRGRPSCWLLTAVARGWRSWFGA